MARVHRPPPPVPTSEPEEMEDNYGVWAEDEFDEFDPGEIYENTDDPKEEDDSDYEQPDEPEPARPPARPLPTPMAPAIPPIPARPGFRPVPSPATLRPEPRVGGVSPRASPLPQVPVEYDDEETYEIIDTPQSPPIEDDDGEVYEVVDEKPAISKPNNPPMSNNASRPLPKPGGGGFGSRAIPSIPLPAFQTKDVPKKQQPKQPEIKKTVSPNLPRRDLPVPPPPGKPTQPGRVTAFQRPSPQPSPPPPPLPEEPEMDDMYTGSDDFYTDAPDRNSSPPPPSPFRGGLAKNANKPIPRPPSECDDEDAVDEYYTEVPETTKQPFARKATADRPIPPLPQPQPVNSLAAALSSSGRFPVEKLQAELARMASRKPKEPEQTADVPSGNMFLNAKSQLKSVNRVESLNTPEKQRLPTVKRAESENIKRLEPADKRGDRKVSKVSDMMSNFESDEREPEKRGMNVSPMLPKKDFSGNRNVVSPASAFEPSRPVASVTPIKKTTVPKPDTSEALAPPLPRPNQFRNAREEGNYKETKPMAAESRSMANDKRALPKPPANDELEGLYSYGWYFSTIERSSAESKILAMKQDGSFLVRKSKRGGESNPFTLTLLYSGFIYNLHIRRRPDQKYALGSEKPDEHVFNSVGDLVNFHRNNPIEVIGDARKNATPGKVVLKASPNK